MQNMVNFLVLKIVPLISISGNDFQPVGSKSGPGTGEFSWYASPRMIDGSPGTVNGEKPIMVVTLYGRISVCTTCQEEFVHLIYIEQPASFNFN